MTRGPSIVIVHKDGTVTYWSPSQRAMCRVPPERVNLTEVSKNDRDRLVSRFGVTRRGRDERLLSDAERRPR